jgi:N-acetylmuramoyl-L-alanine amidase
VHHLLEIGCLDRPDRPRNLTPQELEPVTMTLPLTRFRSTAAQVSNPQESVLMAHPSNFGWRYLKDVAGNPVKNAPIVVLHETTASYESAIELFKSAHDDEDEQVSYHALIREDGKIVYTVPSDRRAYGAGNSVFVNSSRQEDAVKTNVNYAPSVNNFAYHISLVSPEDAYDSDEPTHSGYTKAQYESLAWLVSKTGVPEDRITTHQLVDRSGSRMDPRSFNVPYFLGRLRTYPISQEIAIVCAAP